MFSVEYLYLWKLWSMYLVLQLEDCFYNELYTQGDADVVLCPDPCCLASAYSLAAICLCPNCRYLWHFHAHIFVLQVRKHRLKLLSSDSLQIALPLLPWADAYGRKSCATSLHVCGWLHRIKAPGHDVTPPKRF